MRLIVIIIIIIIIITLFINRNNNNNNNNDDNNILHKTSNSPPNISNNNNSSNILNNIDNDNNNNNNNNNNKYNDNNNKNSKVFSTNKSSSSKNNNSNVVATGKTNDSNITFRSKKYKKYNKIYNNNGSNSNNNNNNENNSNNKSSNNNKVNSIPSSPTSKETVFILGDSMVEKLNGFLLTRKLNHKCLVKIRPFNSAKVRCIHDHAKPTVRDFDPDRIILHCGTNDLNSDRTYSQIAKEIIDLALSLKSEKNRISVSLLTPRSDKLNNKANEVNNRLINISSHRNIAYIDHSSSIQQNHMNESKVHLNRYGTIVFANIFSKFLSEYY